MPLAEYQAFARANFRFLAFGFLTAFTSSAGQTFFIGVFGPDVRATFELSHTEWGTIYLIGTLGSAVALTWTGSLIDRFDLRVFAACAIGGLAMACLAMSATASATLLVLSIFLLRQMGQGLTSHTASTAMARYYTGTRGKALALSSIGFTAGEALLPVLAVTAIATYGWRTSYAGAGVLVACMIPLVLWCLRGHSERHARYLEEEQSAAAAGAQSTSSLTRWDMLREGRFYLLLPAICAPSYIVTAMFFHHLTLAEAKGWSAAWVTGSYWAFGAGTVISLLAAGPLIDRFSAARIMPFFLLPLAAGLLLLVPGADPFWVIPYLFLGGLNSGIYFAGMVSLWAELYGVRHLGAIKSTTGAITVFASALGPVTVGLMLDAGFSMEAVCLLFAAYCVVATPPLIVALKRPRRSWRAATE